MQSRMECKIHKAIGPLDRHEGPRLHGNRNQQRSLCSAPACAPHALVPCPRSNFGTLGPHQLSRFILSWSISIDSHKDKSGRSNLRSVSKSTPDPPDACSKERAQTPPLTRNARNIHKDIYRRCEWNTSVKSKPYTYQYGK